MKYKFLCIVLLFSTTAVVYFPALFHVARSEQNLYLYETADIKNPVDLALYSYSYARTRLFAAGDAIIFRPLLYIFFSIQKSLFGYNFFWWQLVAISLHLLVVWQLLKVLNYLKQGYFAFLFALNFSVLYISQEMIIWQHMTPILLQLFLILMAFNDLIRYLESDPKEHFRIKKMVVCLTVASFIHEFALLCSVVFIFALFIHQTFPAILNRPRESTLRESLFQRYKNIGYLLLPMIIFMSCSMIDYWMRFGRGHSKSSLNPFMFSDTLQNSIRVIWVALVGPIAPFFLDIGFKPWSPSRLADDLSKLNHLFQHQDRGVGLTLNLMLLLLVILTIGLCLWGKAIQWQKISSLKTSDKQFFSLSVKSFAGIVGLLLSLGYIVMIVLSRLNERGFGYLNENLFYLYPIILFAQVFFYKFIITSTEDNFPHQRWVKYGLTLCLLLGIMLNGFKNFNLNIDLKKISERQIKERVINVNDYYMFQKYAARGGLYFKQGAYNAALKDLNQALKIYPFSADVYSTRGLVFDQQGMSDLALADYNTAIKINPTYDVALASRAVLYKQRGEYDLALEDFKKTVLINPVQPTIYNDLGNIYNRKRDFPSAIESYNQAINYDPKMMEAYLNRGIAYTQLKMYSLALNDFNQALQINPLDVKALYQRSEVYAQIGRVDEALEDNNNLIRMIPDYGLLYFNRSKIYKLKQDKQKAMEDALRAKSLGWDVDEEYIQEITRIKN